MDSGHLDGMNYVCSNCGAQCDEIGNPGAVVDPLAKTLGIVCIGCRLAACAERSVNRRPHPTPATKTPKYNGRLAMGNLPYKD